MIDLEKILAQYGIKRIDFCKAMNIHTNNFNRLNDIDNQKFSTIEKIHNITKIPYNILLGRRLFTLNNIDERPDINILDNTSQNNRTFEELKNSIKNELKVELLEELKELNKK